MTNHYAAPGAPPCRCAWCRHQHVQPEPEPLPAIGAPLRILRLVDRWIAEDAAEQERQRIAAEELADWLAQDVH